MSNGLEKIISQIDEEARASADQILREARDKAAAIQREADEALAAAEKENAAKCASLREDILRKSRSAARMQRQREVLAAKQQLIGDVIRDAKESLGSLEGKAYFTLITEMLEKHALGEKGRIRFNQKDLDRLPEGFEQKIAEIAEEKGGSLTLDPAPSSIDGGFVLVYGGIEENCSFASLFDGAMEPLQDKLHGLLFAK